MFYSFIHLFFLIVVPIFVDTSFYDATSITLRYSSTLFWFFPQHENFNVKNIWLQFLLNSVVLTSEFRNNLCGN